MRINNHFVLFVKIIIFICIICFNSNSFAYAKDIKVTVEPIIQRYYNDIILTEKKIILDDKNLLGYYVKDSKLYIFYPQSNTINNHCPELKIPSGYEFDPWGRISFLKLKNGDVFIRQFLQNKDKHEIKKTIAYVYSPVKNKIIFKKELPKEISFYQHTPFELSENKIMFIGDEYKNKDGNKTYIYDLNSKTITQGTDTIRHRRYCSTIELKDGRVLLFGGYRENNTTAEIYDKNKNEFIEIPMGFQWYSSAKPDDLFITDDGKIVIKTIRLMEKEEDGVGAYISGSLGTGYPIPYITVFNPEDNSFKEININNGDKYLTEYSVAVTPNGKIIVGGGVYISKKPCKILNNSDKLIFYDIKTDEISYSTGVTFFPATPIMYILNNHEMIYDYRNDKGTIKVSF